MKLQQGQVWKQGDDYYRIVEWSRLSIAYKAMKDPATTEGTHQQVTKKEFCRLIKDATLLSSSDLALLRPRSSPKKEAPPKRRKRF